MSGPNGNPRTQKRLEARRKERESLLDDALQAVLAQPDGKRVFRWLLFGPCSFYGPTFTGSREIDWREGRRSVGLAVIERLRRVDYRLWSDLVTEDVSEYLDDQIHKRDAERPQQENDDAD